MFNPATLHGPLSPLIYAAPLQVFELHQLLAMPHLRQLGSADELVIRMIALLLHHDGTSFIDRWGEDVTHDIAIAFSAVRIGDLTGSRLTDASQRARLSQ